MSEINRIQAVEIERVQLDEKTIHTIYQVGHSRTSVRSIFSSGHAYCELLQHIILRKLSDNSAP